jgi:hypothetical protein
LARIAGQVTDLLDVLVPDEPDKMSYATIKRALVATHKLTAYQQVDRLMAMEPLGGCKPSELLAAMQKLRSASDDAFFAWAFSQRLPREIRVLLARDDHTDMRAVAKKVGDLLAVHQPKHHDAATVAAVAAPAATGDEEDTVAAATSRSNSKSQRRGKKRGKGGRGGHRSRSPSPFNIHQSPLCYYHVRYSDKAHKCIKPCAWPGN